MVITWWIVVFLHSVNWDGSQQTWTTLDSIKFDKYMP